LVYRPVKDAPADLGRGDFTMLSQYVAAVSNESFRAAFADPEWRGGAGEASEIQGLRPLIQIDQQMERLACWIVNGSSSGWLGVYQARRAAFELRSIRAQMDHERARNDGELTDEDRRAVQSRLDRLEGCVEAARAA
jgi:hypothetical protein